MKSKTNIKLWLALSLVGVVLLSSLFGGCALFDGEDDEPENAATNNGIKDGAIGVYAEDGTLMTDGVNKTYSSGGNYLATPSGKNVYYVQSVTIPVDGLRASYDMTLYVNSPIMGAQFSNDMYKATLKLDLESGKGVDGIDDLIGSETRGEAPQTDA